MCKICKVEGCANKMIAKGYCKKHYNQMKREEIRIKKKNEYVEIVDLDNEVWKDIKGYEGLYKISNIGRIKSLGRLKTNGKNKYISHEIILKPWVNAQGYLCAALWAKGKKVKTMLVHRLVAEAFIPNPNNYPYVNHMDENKQNPKAENLEWCTMEYNFKYGTALERMAESKSKKVYQYSKEGKLIREWKSTKECGRNGYDDVSVWKCCTGKSKTHNGFIWSYKELSKSQIREKVSNKASKKKTLVKGKKIYQYDDNLKLIKEWNTLNELSDSGFDKSNISRCCLGKQKSHKGYIWSYKII